MKTIICTICLLMASVAFSVAFAEDQPAISMQEFLKDPVLREWVKTMSLNENVALVLIEQGQIWIIKKSTGQVKYGSFEWSNKEIETERIREEAETRRNWDMVRGG